MRRRLLLIPLALVLSTSLVACATPTPTPTPSLVSLEFDFRDGALGWEVGFAEYSPEMEIQLEADIRPLPSELGVDGTGYYLQGMNRSDDLFMFLKRRIGPEDGVVAEQTYRIIYEIVFASNAPSGCFGIGGAPGEGVTLKAGAATEEPEVYLDPDTDYYLMNVDKGSGNTGSGLVASEAGNIANGLPCETVDLQNPPYVSLECQHEHEYTIAASPDGELWLLVGTDSGFESLTGVYYQSIAVTLEPVGS